MKQIMEDFEKLLSTLKWTFAKTMPDIPHEYIVIEDYPEKSVEIKEFIDTIAKSGYAKAFYNKEYKYLDLYGYKYWAIDNILNRSKI